MVPCYDKVGISTSRKVEAVVDTVFNKGEQEFAESDPKYNNLLRDVDELSEDIDPYHVL